MHAVDILVLGAYLAIVMLLGAAVSGRQRTARDYFLTESHRVPAWAVFGSIVATETSTVTLISVPGFAFGGDLTFLQLALGYVAGKLLVAAWLIPGYFEGRFLTAYQRLARRFGPLVGRLTAVIFLVTRSVSDGFRLFATGLVLAAMLSAGWLAETRVANGAGEVTTSGLVIALAVVAGATVVYTLIGGMRAVIWTDVMQLVVYVGGAVVAMGLLLMQIPGGWGEVAARAGAAGKLTVIDFSLDVTRSYTFWSGLIGGLFLTAGTHGTDQMFVQRYLCSRTAVGAGRALVWSGVFVFVQFSLFLALGLLLWVYYTTYAPGELAALTADGQVRTDRVLPRFMMTQLPVGVRGLVVASIMAAAMSTLSSSLNSSAASTVGDFLRGVDRTPVDPRRELRVSRIATVGWAVVQLGVAVVASHVSRRVVDEVLGIQSFTLGLLLGTYGLAATTWCRGREVVIGIVSGLGGLVGLRLFTDVSWQWYVLIGATLTWGAAWVAAPARRRRVGRP